MFGSFQAGKCALRALALHRAADDLRFDNERSKLKPGAKLYRPEYDTDSGSLWEQTEDIIDELNDFTVPTRTRLRRRAARLLSALRRTCKHDLQKHATSSRIPDDIRVMAFFALAECDVRTMCYLVLVCDDHRLWSLAHDREWLDQSAMARAQREYNAKRETWRNGSDDEIVIITSTVVEVANHAPQAEGVTLATLRTTGKACVHHGVRKVVKATNARTTDVDPSGFHTTTTYSRKQRFAYCDPCSHVQARRVLFTTFAKRGTAKCDCCGSLEVLTDTPRELGALTAARTIIVSRSLIVREEHVFEQATRGGWLCARVTRTAQDGTVLSTMFPMQTVPVVLANALQKRYRLQQKQK